ncbi:MAG: NAD-dependent epimerase/dehydratase family protein [Candidatus Marinamargulisbacteria bacterium]
MNEQIFITGATGCIGHYVMDQLMNDFPTATFHLLVRDPKRFKSPIVSKDNVMIHRGDMDDIGKYQSVLNQVDYLIHIATVWGYDLDVNIRINRDRMLEMFNYLDEQRIKKIIYFSTASILGPGNQLSDAAKTVGTPYVKSKYHGYIVAKNHTLAPKITTLFPTVVLGGSKHHPYSHISQGLQNMRPILRWARRFKVPGSFHFLHATDIAKMVSISMITPNVPADVVLGNDELTFNDAFLELARFENMTSKYRIPLPRWFLYILTILFTFRMDSWGKHCLKNPDFNYTTHNPKSFQHPVTFPTLTSVLQAMSPKIES